MTIKDEYHYRCIAQVPDCLQEFARELGITLLCDHRQGHQDWIAWVSGESHFSATGQDAQEACAKLLHLRVFGEPEQLDNDNRLERLRKEIVNQIEKITELYNILSRETDWNKGNTLLRLIEHEKGYMEGLQFSLQVFRSAIASEFLETYCFFCGEPDCKDNQCLSEPDNDPD